MSLHRSCLPCPIPADHTPAMSGLSPTSLLGTTHPGPQVHPPVPVHLADVQPSLAAGQPPCSLTHPFLQSKLCSCFKHGGDLIKYP